jgi:hypothetical protein
MGAPYSSSLDEAPPVIIHSSLQNEIIFWKTI